MNQQKYKISILLPTRGRIQSLEKSLVSLLSRAHDPTQIEILLALDRDDKEVINFATTDLKKLLETQYRCGYTAMAFNPIGYIRLNEYLNALARISQGDWLFFYNDDAVMDTQDWDLEIKKYTGQFRVLRAETTNQHPYAIFPIIPREWTQVTGYISPHQINDAWVSHIAYLLDIMVDIPVFVHHERFDLTGLNNDETYKNRPMLEGNHNDPRDFNHSNWREIRLRDANKICNYIEKTENRICDWFRDGCAGKIDIWAKMYAADTKNRLTRIDVNQ
jgi:hypothetical protein